MRAIEGKRSPLRSREHRLNFVYKSVIPSAGKRDVFSPKSFAEPESKTLDVQSQSEVVLATKMCQNRRTYGTDFTRVRPHDGDHLRQRTFPRIPPHGPPFRPRAPWPAPIAARPHLDHTHKYAHPCLFCAARSPSSTSPPTWAASCSLSAPSSSAPRWKAPFLRPLQKSGFSPSSWRLVTILAGG
jgi:hypothetical protein